LGALDADTVLRLLKDEHPRVREQAVLLSERWLAKSAPLQERVVELVGDADPQVRYQVALSLGEWDDDRILAPLAKVAVAGPEDRWTRLAVASSVPKRAGALIALLARPGQGLTAKPTAGRLALLEELAAVAGGRRDAAEVAAVLDALGAVGGADALRWQMAGLQGPGAGMGPRGTQLGEVLQELPERQPAAADKAAALLEPGAAAAAGARRAPTERLTAIRVLGHAPWEPAEPVLTRLLADDPSQDVRLAAVRALSAHTKPEVPGLLMKPWKGYAPTLRREVTE